MDYNGKMKNVMLVSTSSRSFPMDKGKLINAIRALPVKFIVSDLAPGWNFTGAEVAQQSGIPVFGLFPFPPELFPHEDVAAFERVRGKVKTSIQFNDSISAFIKSPDSYYTWVRDNIDAVLFHDTGEYSPFSQNLMINFGDAKIFSFNEGVK